jgi:hypothetical protein
LYTRGKINLTRAITSRTTKAFDQFANTVGFQSQVAQYPTSDTTFFLDQGQKQVLSADGVLPHPFSFLMSQAKHPASSLGKSFHTGQEKFLLN